MTKQRTLAFFVGFALVALVIAGALSYLADSNPDGLDSATLEGCEVVTTDAGEELVGDCIAKNADDHQLADSPLADYAVGGDDRFTGIAGVLGVLATAVVAGGLFWLLRRRPRDTADATSTGATAGKADAGAGSTSATTGTADASTGATSTDTSAGKADASVGSAGKGDAGATSATDT